MSLLQFNNLSEAVLTELANQRCPESQTLDFKQVLPSTSDRDKSEFLKDVCGLANRDGGDIVYGMSEEDGTAKAITPITTEAPDAAQRRLGQVLDAGMEPRVIGIQFKDISVAGGFVLVVRVPASFNGPHRYTVNNVSRFALRNGTYTTEMNYEQLRTAFDRTATLAQRASDFRQERLLSLSNRQAWRPLVDGPFLIVHLVPLAAMVGGQKIDIQSLYNNYTPFTFAVWGGATRSTNLEGLIAYPPGRSDGRLTAYTQLFRTGALETGLSVGREFEGRKIFPSGPVTTFVREAIGAFLQQSRVLGNGGPAIAGIAILSIGDYSFVTSSQLMIPALSGADRNHLILPDAWVNDIETATNVDDLTRPLLDTLWQAFDIECCPYYDTHGHWLQRPRPI